jgi:LacI family transcriptional regulator
MTPLGRRAVMREVAALAGVALSSVSRVLSDHPDVSEAMRERVLVAVEELGYTPDLLAQSLRTQRTRSVGFVVGDISNPIISQMVKGAETTLSEAGYSTLLTNSLVEPDLEVKNIVLLAQRRVDALILLLVHEDNQPTLNVLERLEIPLVLIERDVPATITASRVLSDHRHGMEEAVTQLLELGHRRIALIVGQPVRPTRERLSAFNDVLARAGAPQSVSWVREGFYSVEHGAVATRELLDMSEPPTAIIAGANQIMIGALQVISERGLDLGVDLSFVGCDDISIASLYRPPVAVIDRDIEALGRTAAELVLESLQTGGGEVRTVVHPTDFLARPSCGPAPQESGSWRKRAARSVSGASAGRR